MHILGFEKYVENLQNYYKIYKKAAKTEDGVDKAVPQYL